MYAAVILAGGAARRVGGATKPALTVGGEALLTRVLAAAGPARPRIVVGPPVLAGLLPADVIITREDPPGGGPVAAIAAGVSLLDPAGPEFVALIAGDLPFLSTRAIDALRDRLMPDHRLPSDQGQPDRPDGAVLTDRDGRPQWLAGVWRVGPLLARLAAIGDPSGQSVRHLVGGLRVDQVHITDQPGPPPWFDCDTDDDLRQAEEWARADLG